MRSLVVIACLLLGSCASPRAREREAETLGYEQGYRQAVKEQYWIIQNRQRHAAPANPIPGTP